MLNSVWLLLKFKKNPYRYCYNNYFDRQTGEAFLATSQNWRVIYDRQAEWVRRCCLPIERTSLQDRKYRYRRTPLFIQRERNPEDNNFDIFCELAVNVYLKNILCTQKEPTMISSLRLRGDYIFVFELFA